jgi:hypothetical protein
MEMEGDGVKDPKKFWECKVENFSGWVAGGW